MILAEVLIERSANALNRKFTYLYPFKQKISEGVRVVVPFNHKDVVGYVVNIKEDPRDKQTYEEEVGFILLEIKSVIDKYPLLDKDMLSLAKEVSQFYLSPLISVLQSMLPESLKPKYSALKGPKIKYDKYLTLVNDDEDRLTNKQIELLRLIKQNKQVLKKDVSLSIANNLIKLNRIKEIYIEKDRYVLPEYEKEIKNTLTHDQAKAINSILNSKNKITLLEGVTGSGKTEVYLSIAEKVINSGRNVIMLVPEISMTSMMVRYFITRFKNKVAILHSDLTLGEKYDEYRRIAKGEAQIVVGARSAIFAPIKNIGLIILDEEHVESYKQDVVPTYHAREVAFMRARRDNSLVILGSATPLLETRARAIKGVYNYVKLPNRINKQPLPKTYIVNMLKTENLYYRSSMFSNLLINKIKDRLDKKEQIILLVNRRGFSTSFTCRECGKVIKCPNCNIPLTYHKEDNLLKCHHCGHVTKVPNVCPACGSNRFFKVGFGTEKIIEELSKIFPNTKMLRLDSDVSKARNNVTKVIEAFKNKEADILVGTQMIAKGHDFPSVTLVGIVLADIGLSIPSFRNTERVFTLITQAIGRSGRSDLEGEAVVQTYLPNHYAIKLGSEQNYDEFYKKEMSVRSAAKYPPYTYLISLSIKAKNKDMLEDISYRIASDLTKREYKDVTILGPSTPFISYQGNYFIKEILIKYKNDKEIRNYIEKLLITLQNKSGVNISVNVDPYDY